MKKALLFTTIFLLGATSFVSAQRQPAGAVNTPRNWVTVYGTMFTNMSDFDDPTSDSRWELQDNAFGLGLAFQREFGQGLLLGVDVSASKPDYQRIDLTAPIDTVEGSATVATAMVTGRFATGGGLAQLGLYLTGGIGTIAYKLEDLDGWNSDFALRAGTGLEYRFNPRSTLFLEWGRVWGYHEKEGVSGGRVNHSNLKLGTRIGF